VHLIVGSRYSQNERRPIGNQFISVQNHSNLNYNTHKFYTQCSRALRHSS